MKKLIYIGLAAFALTSCNLYPGGDTRTEQLDVVVTQYDLNADFSTMKTYAVSDSVKPISSDPNSPPSFIISDEMSNVVIQTVKANMAGYGWTLVDTSMKPDLVIDLSATVTRNTNVYGSYPGYGWGYPGYGWGYPWYPYYTTVTSYEVGSFVLVGLDFKNIDHTNQTIPVLWHGLAQGPIINNVDDPLSRVQRDIDQVFEQSPYLNVN